MDFRLLVLHMVGYFMCWLSVKTAFLAFVKQMPQQNLYEEQKMSAFFSKDFFSPDFEFLNLKFAKQNTVLEAPSNITN